MADAPAARGSIEKALAPGTTQLDQGESCRAVSTASATTAMPKARARARLIQPTIRASTSASTAS